MPRSAKSRSVHLAGLPLGGPGSVDLPRTGRYRLERRLAVGGMAEVFAARSCGLHGFEKTVVIKRILPELATDRRYVAMFLDEAKLTARLNHPALIQTFDIGVADGIYYLAMEHIDGADLADIARRMRMRAQSFTYEQILALALPVAEGLSHAHGLTDEHGASLGVVHRDVSPSNIMVTRDGTVKLVDFGIAKWASSLKTTSGERIKGKYTYLSPEQARAGHVDHRSDIFSFGVVLYELVTGRGLFSGVSPAEILHRITQSLVPDPRRWRPDLPHALERVLCSALQPDREHRYHSFRHLLADLEELARRESLHVTGRTLSDLMAQLFSSSRSSPPASGTPQPTSRPTEGLITWRPPPELAASPLLAVDEATTVCDVPRPARAACAGEEGSEHRAGHIGRVLRAAVLAVIVLALSSPSVYAPAPSGRSALPLSGEPSGAPRAAGFAHRHSHLDRVIVRPLNPEMAARPGTDADPARAGAVGSGEP